MTGKTDTDFEASLKKLEQIVRELESGVTSLNESLNQFEEGIVLYKQCRQTLEGAEKKIKILSDSLKEIEHIAIRGKYLNDILAETINQLEMK